MGQNYFSIIRNNFRMNLPPEDIALIEKYVNGNLDPQESKAFRVKMESEDFAAEVRFYESLKRSGKELGREEIRSQMLEWDHESDNTVQIRRRWMIAAAISLLCIAAVAYFYVRDYANVDIYQVHFKQFPNLVDPIEKGNSEASTISQLYESRNYMDAASSVPTDSLQRFYQALAYMESEAFADAALILEELASTPGFRFMDEARWYLALCYYRQQRWTDSRTLFENIGENDDHPYQMESIQLLEQWPSDE